jgi:hypothetical protein
MIALLLFVGLLAVIIGIQWFSSFVADQTVGRAFRSHRDRKFNDDLRQFQD